MSAPFRPVSNEVLERVGHAIDHLARDQELPRTKRSLEKLSGLSHDAVARAFRHDRELGSAVRLNDRFDALTDQADDHRSPLRQQLDELRERNEEQRQLIRDLQADRAALAQLSFTDALEDDGDVVPIHLIRRPR